MNQICMTQKLFNASARWSPAYILHTRLHALKHADPPGGYMLLSTLTNGLYEYSAVSPQMA